MADENSTAQLPTLIKEWMATEEAIKTLSAELRENKKRIKVVRGMITQIMKANKVGQLNFSAGHLRTRVKAAKAPMTKKFLLESLTEFFKGDEEMAKQCAAFLDGRRPMKETETLELDAVGSPPTPGSKK